MNWLWVFLGGGLGAAARYAITLLLPPVSLSDGQFPWATLLANLLACILLGWGLGMALREQLAREGQLLLLTGFCGGFSTFSTFVLEVLQLYQGGHAGAALFYIAISILVGTLSLVAILFIQTGIG